FDRFLPPRDYRVTVALATDYRRSDLPDLNLLDRQPSLNSFDPLRPDGFERFIRLVNAKPTPKLLFAGAVGRVYDTVGQPIPALESAEVLRTWIVGQVKTVSDPAAAEQAMLASDWQPQRTAIVEGTFTLSGGSSSPEGVASIVQETPLELTIQTD